MTDTKTTLVENIYKHFKNSNHQKYDEELHSKLLITVMLDKNKGTLEAFCAEAKITERTFRTWLNTHTFFAELYGFCKILARQAWEQEGRELRDREYQMGTINYAFEHWKLIGWSKFGVSKNSRLKLGLIPTDTPEKHYQAIIRQAAEGDFTASEFKQLMEAVNVGINAHEVLELQNQIDELKSDLSIISANKDVKNPFSNKGTAKKD